MAPVLHLLIVVSSLTPSLGQVSRPVILVYRQETIRWKDQQVVVVTIIPTPDQVVLM